MPRLSKEAKRASLAKKRAKIDKELKILNGKEKKAARKEDARRKIIVGALAWEHATKNPGSAFAAKIREMIADYVKPDARHLFDFLPPLPDAPKATVTPAPKSNIAKLRG